MVIDKNPLNGDVTERYGNMITRLSTLGNEMSWGWGPELRGTWMARTPARRQGGFRTEALARAWFMTHAGDRQRAALESSAPDAGPSPEAYRAAQALVALHPGQSVDLRPVGQRVTVVAEVDRSLDRPRGNPVLLHVMGTPVRVRQDEALELAHRILATEVQDVVSNTGLVAMAIAGVAREVAGRRPVGQDGYTFPDAGEAFTDEQLEEEYVSPAARSMTKAETQAAEKLAQARAAVEVAKAALAGQQAIVEASTGKSRATAQAKREKLAIALVKAEQRLERLLEDAGSQSPLKDARLVDKRAK